MLNTSDRLAITYFVGYEVEHTICYGVKTLFVIGTPDSQDVIAEAAKHQCTHIYLGTSQSFKPFTIQQWAEWDILIDILLDQDFWVTLDFGVEYANDIPRYTWNDRQRFVPMISVKLPNIQQYNYNATLKLDVPTWGVSNPGVWTHQLHDLMAKDKFTHWDQYTKDTAI